MKQSVIGILAHVDAGKTTLSEALLYVSGSIRKMGRVDKGDAFLDTDDLEKERGITIFSKQARFTYGGMEVTLLDTPGHVDFSAEMERTLQILDYAILVINGANGVQGHTVTLWQLLKKYEVPVFLFINKMDQEGVDKLELLENLKRRLHENCVDFSTQEEEEFFENIAITSEPILETYLGQGRIKTEQIKELIAKRKIFPCYFGSALKLYGVERFLDGIKCYTVEKIYGHLFGARIFKINRDDLGNRLTHMKITGGSLKVKDILITGQGSGEEAPIEFQEKVNQIRIYSGAKYDTVTEVGEGCICAVTGPVHTKAGQGMGVETGASVPVLVPVLTYQLILPKDCDPISMLVKLKQLEEEEPELRIVWEDKLQEIQVQLMGQVQVEVLTRLIGKRFGVEVLFGTGNMVYRETIAKPVIGVGHYEPLKHYAEVHLLMEPGETGSGLSFASTCDQEQLGGSWQRLILSHLAEKEHRGVRVGGPITDMKITLIAGQSHQKHTQGGDFRQATYRAVRQGLMQAKSIVLEPYYRYRLEVPEAFVGKAMVDLECMCASMEGPVYEKGMTVFEGSGPAVGLGSYYKDVIAYTKGQGRIFTTFDGFAPCHNEDQVAAKVAYEVTRDLAHTPDSLFCAHGAGFVVPWHKVKGYMHVESGGYLEEEGAPMEQPLESMKEIKATQGIGEDEINRIYQRTFYANQGEKKTQRIKRQPKRVADYDFCESPRKRETKEEYLLVDGYNIIYAWKELQELAKDNMEGARGRLLDIMCNYQGIKKCKLIVVFDAYRVMGDKRELEQYHNIHVVYTKQAETADQYIEKFAHENGKKYDIVVATSDGLEQIIIMGQGCRLFSARELQVEVEEAGKRILEEYEQKQEVKRNFLGDSIKKSGVQNSHFVIE